MSPAPDDAADHADLTATAQAGGEAGCTDSADCITTTSVNDDFSVSTTDGCGRINFVDFGDGAPGGGSNDDYTVIHEIGRAHV